VKQTSEVRAARYEKAVGHTSFISTTRELTAVASTSAEYVQREVAAVNPTAERWLVNKCRVAPTDVLQLIVPEYVRFSAIVAASRDIYKSSGNEP
jgi:hypothetical protein